MWALARRPLWIGLLALALALAAGFAALGQWQLERSVQSGAVVIRTTEQIVPLESVAVPQGPVSDAAAGHRVQVEVRFVPDQYLVIADRLNGARSGFWVVDRAEVLDAGEEPAASEAATPDGASIAIALGWTEDADAAASVADSLELDTRTIAGRYLPSDTPQTAEFEDGPLGTLSIAELVNLWSDFDGDVYGGYVVADEPVPGLEAIDSPAPDSEVSLNLLNVFYALEWAVFAGFAVFMWYRLMKDAWEREVELAAEAREAAGSVHPGGHPGNAP